MNLGICVVRRTQVSHEEILALWEWMKSYWPQMVDDWTPQTLEQLEQKYAADVLKGAKFHVVTCAGALVGAVWAEPIADGMYMGHLVFARGELTRSQRLEAARTAIKDMFANGTRKIIWQLFPDNKAFEKFLLTLGAVVEGRLHEGTRKNGELKDIVLMASFRDTTL